MLSLVNIYTLYFRLCICLNKLYKRSSNSDNGNINDLLDFCFYNKTNLILTR